jgi:imidazoleglycerol-phosphate dehydratase
MIAKRAAETRRKTGETDISLRLSLDGNGHSQLQSGIGFLDHMLTLFAKHSLIDLELACAGDLHVDGHHTTEDIGIVLGQCLHQALGDKAGIHRYGHVMLPMDETLVSVAIDLSGRSKLVYKAMIPSPKIGDFDTELVPEFWEAFSREAKCNLHILLHHGQNSHHIVEAMFKGVARALRMAVELDPKQPGIPSTKGSL